MRMKEKLSVYTVLLLACSIILALVIAAGCSGKQTTRQLTTIPVDTRSEAGGLISSGKYRGVAVADMDNDGKLDVVGGGAGTVAIWYGEGSNGMGVPQFVPVKGEIQSVAVADFNEDGLNDIVISVQGESSGIMMLLNAQRGKWIKAVGPTEINRYQGVLAADVNRDGHLDILAANVTSDVQGGVQVWLGDGQGRWPRESGPTVTGTFMDVAAADFDGNGTMDIVAAGWGGYGSLRVWLGDGSGSWSAAADPVAEGSFYGVTAVDLNGDGRIDVLAGTYRQGVRVFLGDGKGRFVETAGPRVQGSFWRVLASDLDGDGVRDLLASSVDGAGIKAWRNEPNKAWSPMEGRFPDRGSYYDMAVGDLNRDGRDDICAASFGEGVKMWLGKGGVSHRAGPTPAVMRVDLQDQATPEDVFENDVFTSSSGFAEYKIGPGDVLEITLWKGASAVRELLRVKADGKISYGYVEDIDVNGSTPSQLDALLTERLKEYVKSPRIDVVVKEYNSKFVTLMGAIGVHRAGAGAGKYELIGRTTILEMLSKAGGPTRDANLSDVRIRRKNNRSFSVDLYKAITQGDLSQDIVLNDGDLIYVPAISKESNRVYVFGEVTSPGVYTFSGSEMRLFDAISQAGGVTVFAHSESTKIVRGDITRPEIVSPNLKQLVEEGDQTQNIALANGDLVYVPRSFIGDVNLFVQRIRPLLQVLFAPAQFLDVYNINE